MTSVVAKARLRLIGMNPSNTAGNEVEGTATGGIEKIVAAEGKKVYACGIWWWKAGGVDGHGQDFNFEIESVRRCRLFYAIPTLAFPRLVCAQKVLVYGIVKGNLEHVFSGDEPGRHTGELLGHSGVITALFFYKHMVYTGSMDCTVQVPWE